MIDTEIANMIFVPFSCLFQFSCFQTNDHLYLRKINRLINMAESLVLQSNH